MQWGWPARGGPETQNARGFSGHERYFEYIGNRLNRQESGQLYLRRIGLFAATPDDAARALGGRRLGVEAPCGWSWFQQSPAAAVG
jgi:hypothetical protein